MNRWLDIFLVAIAVLASAAYAIYALGPKRRKDVYSRFATKHFGLRAARWLAGDNQSCNNCSESTQHEKPRF